MKKRMKVRVLWLAAMWLVCGQISAQGFLKKVSKGVDKISAVAGNATGVADGQSGQKIVWDSIPVYVAQKVILTDEGGQVLLNEDGTQQIRVLLVDQFGRRRSPEAVKQQQEAVRKAVVNVLKNTATGAGVGALTGLVSGGKKGAIGGAVGGTAAGLLASADDIKHAKKQRESLKQQEALLEAYQKNFNEEGVPVNASVDPATIEGLALDEKNTVSETTSKIMAEISSAEFKDSDMDAFDSMFEEGNGGSVGAES